MKRPLLWCVCCYTAGVFATLKEVADMILLPVICLELLFFLFIHYKKDRKRWDSVFLALPIFFAFGYLLSGVQIRPHSLDRAVSSKASGVVSGEIYRIEEKEKTQVWYLKHAVIQLESKHSDSLIPAKKIIVYPKTKMDVKIGYKIRGEGQISVFLHPTNPGQFHEYNYYKSQGFICKFYSKSTEITNRKIRPFFQFLYEKKQKFLDVYQNILPEKESGIVAAMLLGEKTYLDAEVKEMYQVNGMAHLLAISGLHISMIGSLLFQILRKTGLSPVISVLLSLAFLWIYGYFTNFSISTQRAVMMLSLSFFGICFGRSYDLLTSLALSAFILLVREPLLLYDGGFLLSFSAVLGIAVCTPVLKELFIRERIEGEVKEAFWITSIKSTFISSFSVTIMTLPVILLFFFEFPTYSLLANLFVIPLMSILLFMAIIGGLIGCFNLLLGKFFCGIIYLILWFYEELCRWMEKLPFHSLLIGQPGKYKLLLFYGIGAVLIVVFSGIFYNNKNLDRVKKEKRKMGGRIAIFAMLVVLFFPVKSRELRITVMDVGQGDGICIQNTTGTTYFIDGGSSSVNKVGTYRIKPFLKASGIAGIDYAILTHMDADHISGIRELIEESGEEKQWIKVLCMPDTSLQDEAFAEMVQLAKEKGIEVRYLKKGDKISDGKLTLSCLHPEPSYQTVSRNDASTVLSLSYGDISMLLTGDLEELGESYIRSAGLLKATTLLKVAHHGSKYSTDASFLELTMPYASIISCGKDNSYGHPHKELLMRLNEYGVKIYNTMDIGAIFVTTDGKNIKLKGFRNGGNK